MEIDAKAAGFDEGRLERITEHLDRRYLEPGKIAGCQVTVERGGHVAYHRSFGRRDLEADRPVTEDTIWRIYSMTKPITGVALLSLYEHGHFQLDDPVHRFLPQWRDLKVRERTPDGETRLVEPRRPMTIRDLLMHTSGLGYEGRGPALLGSSPDLPGNQPGATLDTVIDWLADRPLHSHPGERWRYSVSTDVCGKLVEIISGRSFDEYLQEEILDPLGMVDTGFHVPDEGLDRFAASYRRNSRKQLRLVESQQDSEYRRPPSYLSGGGGLVSTSADYLRFCRMLANGGELGGVRILGRHTVEMMASNHLPGGADLREVATGGFGEVGFDGMGFGLTVAVSMGPVRTGVLGSAGSYSWGGFASTIFWIDPAEDLVVVFMTQLIPSGTFNFRDQLKTIVYPAIAE